MNLVEIHIVDGTHSLILKLVESFRNPRSSFIVLNRFDICRGIFAESTFSDLTLIKISIFKTNDMHSTAVIAQFQNIRWPINLQKKKKTFQILESVFYLIIMFICMQCQSTYKWFQILYPAFGLLGKFA